MSTHLNHHRVRAVQSTMTGTLLFLIGVLVGVLALAAYVNMHSPGTLPYSNVSATRPAPERFEPCPTDEGGMPGPCVWDARHMGNGIGTSFFVNRFDTRHVVRHKRAHCMVRWHVRGTCKPVTPPSDGGLFD